MQAVVRRLIPISKELGKKETATETLLECIRDPARKLINYFPYQSALAELKEKTGAPVYAMIPGQAIADAGLVHVAMKAFRLLLGDQHVREDEWAGKITVETIRDAATHVVEKAHDLDQEFQILKEKYSERIALYAVGEGEERARELQKKERELRQRGYSNASIGLAVLAEDHFDAADKLELYIALKGWAGLGGSQILNNLFDEFSLI